MSVEPREIGEAARCLSPLNHARRVLLFGCLRERAFADEAPNATWRRRHVDVADAIMRQSIYHRVRDRCRRADCSDLSTALHTHRRVHARRTVR
jgi:hypothetical protein